MNLDCLRRTRDEFEIAAQEDLLVQVMVVKRKTGEEKFGDLWVPEDPTHLIKQLDTQGGEDSRDLGALWIDEETGEREDVLVVGSAEGTRRYCNLGEAAAIFVPPDLAAKQPFHPFTGSPKRHDRQRLHRAGTWIEFEFTTLPSIDMHGALHSTTPNPPPHGTTIYSERRLVISPFKASVAVCDTLVGMLKPSKDTKRYDVARRQILAAFDVLGNDAPAKTVIKQVHIRRQLVLQILHDLEHEGLYFGFTRHK